VRYGNPSSYPMPRGARLAALRGQIAATLDPDVEDVPAAVAATERYALAGAFVGYVIERHGPAAFSSFVRELVADPTGWRESFEHHTGESFTTALGKFQRSLFRGIPASRPHG